MTSGPVRRCESVPAPLHESARPAGRARLVGLGLGPPSRWPRHVDSYYGGQYLRNPMTSPTGPPF